MNPKQIQLVQESFAEVLPVGDLATVRFYGKVFASK
jgi:hypothetical protein